MLYDKSTINDIPKYLLMFGDASYDYKNRIGSNTNFVPVSVAKDSELLVSQYDNSVAEEAGLLKMDFLGLKTLTIIKDALEIIKDRYGADIDIDAISSEDELTFEHFRRGEMVGIFHYESSRMQKQLRILVPSRCEYLMTTKGLYRLRAGKCRP